MKPNIITLPGSSIINQIRSGEITAEEYIIALLDRITEKNNVINAYVKVIETQAVEKARTLDRKIRNGQRVGRLAGFGVAVKDNIRVCGVETTCASEALRGYMSSESATVVKRIEAEDGIVLGKANLDEFGVGDRYSGYSCFGPVHNPWDLTRYPGGSSGGSAAAVATCMATVALGSDTGGL